MQWTFIEIFEKLYTDLYTDTVFIISTFLPQASDVKNIFLSKRILWTTIT